MSAVDDFSDDEVRSNVLNDPGFFLDLEEDDDDVVLPHAVPQRPPSEQQQREQAELSPAPEQQPTMQSSSSNSRISGVGVPKLDVTALNNVSLNLAAQAQQGYGTAAITNSPMTYLRDGAGGDHFATAFGPSSHNSSPHNTTTSPNVASFNVYSNIVCPPLCARKLNFRDFLNQKAVPPNVEGEESAGIFVGQLPSSYSEDDIEALLKAIGHEHGQTVQVRDVKSHNRDRTCAFIMINASALNAVLDFSKRVLCDINCVWVVDHSQALQLPIFIQQMPRDHLRGVPKAALVLERLTPQSKSRHSVHNTSTNPSAGYGAMQTNLISPLNVMSHPIYLQPPQQQQQPPQQQPPQQQGSSGNGGGMPNGGMMPPAAFMDASGLQASLPFNGSGFMSSSAGGNGLPQLFNTGAFQNSAAAGALFNTANVATSPTSVYAMQMAANGGIANIEAANQMMIAASRSQANSQSQQLNIAPLSPPSGPTDNATPVPTAVQLTPALQQEHCSCGRMLFLSQYPKAGTCAKCNSAIVPREVAYWCPSGHIAVCIRCALQTSIATESSSGVNMRFVQPQGEMLLQ